MTQKKKTSRINVRIDEDAKNIIEASNETARSILEGYAYGCLFDTNIAERAGINFNIREELNAVRDDIDHLRREEKYLTDEKERLEAQLKRCQRNLNRNQEQLEIKEQKLDSLEAIKENLKQEPVDLDAIKNERLENAVSEVRDLLQANEDKRNSGSFVPRVAEKKLNTICSKYKVRLSDVAQHLEPVLIKGIENPEKYL